MQVAITSVVAEPLRAPCCLGRYKSADTAGEICGDNRYCDGREALGGATTDRSAVTRRRLNAPRRGNDDTREYRDVTRNPAPPAVIGGKQ